MTAFRLCRRLGMKLSNQKLGSVTSLTDSLSDFGNKGVWFPCVYQVRRARGVVQRLVERRGKFPWTATVSESAVKSLVQNSSRHDWNAQSE
jgi:hypothetical protein